MLQLYFTRISLFTKQTSFRVNTLALLAGADRQQGNGTHGYTNVVLNTSNAKVSSIGGSCGKNVTKVTFDLSYVSCFYYTPLPTPLQSPLPRCSSTGIAIHQCFRASVRPCARASVCPYVRASVHPRERAQVHTCARACPDSNVYVTPQQLAPLTHVILMTLLSRLQAKCWDG